MNRATAELRLSHPELSTQMLEMIKFSIETGRPISPSYFFDTNFVPSGLSAPDDPPSGLAATLDSAHAQLSTHYLLLVSALEDEKKLKDNLFDLLLAHPHILSDAVTSRAALSLSRAQHPTELDHPDVSLCEDVATHKQNLLETNAADT
jgi:hypothetical protein